MRPLLVDHIMIDIQLIMVYVCWPCIVRLIVLNSGMRLGDTVIEREMIDYMEL